MSLPWAEFISVWSNWMLIGALIIGVVATYGIVVSGNVKESAANTEIARLSSEAEASRAAIADANARALEAQAQLAQFKAPRTVTEAQALRFIEEATKYSGTQADIWIIGDTPEPTGIAQIILKLLETSLMEMDRRGNREWNSSPGKGRFRFGYRPCRKLSRRLS